MILEQLVFAVISLFIFVYMFFRMIKNNDTTYVILLVLQAIGIALNFVEVLFGIKINFVFIILKYLLSIALPILIIVVEKNYGNLYEIIGIQKAKIAIFFGNDKKAKNILLGLIEKNNNNYKAHKMIAEIYEREGGSRKAIDEYVNAIDLNKKDYESYYKVAELLNGLGKKNESQEMLFNLLNKKPDMYKASELLGDLLLQQEMYKEAVNVYLDALRYNPVSFDLNYNVAIAFTMLNDFQSAKLYYEKAAQINSLVYNSKYCLAEIALMYKELEEAEKRLLEAVESEELSADGYLELAKIAMIKGEKDKAINYVNVAIDQNSKKIVPKVKKDPIFIPILAKIAIPFNLEEPEIKGKKLSKKEIKAKEHLEQMSELTRNLGYNNIDFIKKEEKENENSKIKERPNQE